MEVMSLQEESLCCVVLADRCRTFKLLEVSAAPVRLLWIHRELEVVKAIDDHNWFASHARCVLDIWVEPKTWEKDMKPLVLDAISHITICS